MRVFIASRGQQVAPDSCPTAFCIEVEFEGGLNEAQRAAFQNAALRWTRVIVGDVPAGTYNGRSVDDLLIFAHGEYGAGRGGTSGRTPGSDGAAQLSGDMLTFR